MPKRKRACKTPGKRVPVRDHEKTGEIIPGVRATKSGKYEARTRDPIKRKTVHLGTFNTVQQASEAKRRSSANNQSTSMKPVVDEKTGEKLAGIRTWKSGKYGARVYYPVNKARRVLLGTFDTVQVACKAYRSRRAQNKAAVAKRCRGHSGEQPPTSEDDIISDDADSSSDSEEAVEEIEVEESSVPDFILKILEEFGEENEMTPEKSSSMEIGEEEVVREMQQRAVEVKDEKYGGGGAMGFLIPLKVGQNNLFLPVIDNYGNLLGRFGEIDYLSLRDWL